MGQVSGNHMIAMHRGDTMVYPFLITIGDGADPRKYVLKPGDKVYFGVLEPHAPFEYAIIRKKYTNADLDANDCVRISLSPSDTINLVPGVYYYEIKLENASGVATLCGRKKFIILE